MSSRREYLEYAQSDAHHREYARYQERYHTSIREMDRVTLEIAQALLDAMDSDVGQASLMDVGCGAGALLHHARQRIPGLRLLGVEAAPAVLEFCRENPELEGITFQELDIVAGHYQGDPVDIATLTGVCVFFDFEQFEAAIQNLARVVRPGGSLILFDAFHPFEQRLEIREQKIRREGKEGPLPEGLYLNFRPYSDVRRALAASGFEEPEFRPFHVPLDLALEGYDEFRTHTVKREDGMRMSFRGALYQPWCHMIARRSAA